MKPNDSPKSKNNSIVSNRPETLVIESKHQESGGKNERKMQRKIGIVPSPWTVRKFSVISGEDHTHEEKFQV